MAENQIESQDTKTTERKQNKIRIIWWKVAFWPKTRNFLRMACSQVSNFLTVFARLFVNQFQNLVQ